MIVAVITWSTWSLLRGGIELSLNAVPEGVDAEAVRNFLEGLPGVLEVHDLHIWPMSTTETALTAHLVMRGGLPGDRFLMDAQEELRDHHRIGHVTLQVEMGEVACPLAPAEVV